MINFTRSGPLFFILSFLIAVAGCTQMQPFMKTDAAIKADLSGLPYHPIIYHLDLSILAYKLYGQTLVWPFDPYYEILAEKKEGRKRTVEKVRSWATSKGMAHVRGGAKLGGYRGPGSLTGFSYNSNLDPIIYRYDHLYPWRRALTFADNLWTEHQTPSVITEKISDVYMCYRQNGKPASAVAVEKVATGGKPAAPDASDIVLAFEGGTGDKGVAGQPAAQSLMGFVLLRHLPGSKNYDVHIAFRGSQSGSVQRAALSAFSQDKAGGNPDWVTDLGYDRVGPKSGGGHISSKGSVHRGFSTSMKSIYPQLFACLSKVAQLQPQQPPNNIYVTGHSLGGGLAQHFVSSVLLGDWYGPNGQGISMPSQLRNWPWRKVKLITYSAPRAGDAEWAETLTTNGLESDFFTAPILTIDLKSLKADHPSIVPRLTNPYQPAGYRVLISNDPISTEKVAGGKHVGQTIYANEASLFSLSTAAAHDPLQVRKLLLKILDDPSIPKPAAGYRQIDVMNKALLKDKRSTDKKLEDRASQIERYYSEYNPGFDQKSFRQDFHIYKDFLQGE